MEIPTFKLYEEEYEKICKVLDSLMKRSSVAAASLISRTGQELVFAGDSDVLDRDSIASLAAGSLAATLGLAHLLGEEEFERIYHLGREKSVVTSPVGKSALLLVVLPNGQNSKKLVKILRRTVMLLRDILDRNSLRYIHEDNESTTVDSFNL
jgi:predicted regulator of Ras-like GTPase activity (Roadblock/LC7/MglB family)